MLNLVYLLIAFFAFAADQVLKAAVREAPVESVLFRIDGIIEITHCTNTGAAFSFLQGYPKLIAAVSVFLLVAAAYYLVMQRGLNLNTKVSIALLLGGGLGNFFDRIALGGVTDYIKLLFIQFPVFNFADILITMSVALISFNLLTGRLDVYPDHSEHGRNH